jgi:polysaccharide biosynthesis transport protein
VASQPPKVLFQTGDNGGGDYHQYQETQKNLVRSRLVVSAALRDPRIARYQMVRERVDPVAWLQERLIVGFVGGSEVMEISLAGGNPEEVAGIVNAVVCSYTDEVVNFELKRRMDRFERLKKIKETYSESLKKRRETVRKLSESLGRGEPLADAGHDGLLRHDDDLRTRRTQLRMERAEVESLLARRKKGEGAAAEPVRKEIVQLEDRLAVLTASQVALDEELERLAREMHDLARLELGLKDHKEEIAQMEEARRRIAAEVEALTIELEAPPRIRLIDQATPSRR